MGIYVIQYKQDPTYVLGVNDQIANSPVVVRKQGTPNRFVLWDINFDTGVISLNSSGGTLALDPQGDRVAPEVPLVLAPVNPAAAGQRYDVITKPNYLLSVANHQLCIDNKGRGLSNGNPVWLYQFNGSPAQQWNLVPLMNLTLAV